MASRFGSRQSWRARSSRDDDAAAEALLARARAHRNSAPHRAISDLFRLLASPKSPPSACSAATTALDELLTSNAEQFDSVVPQRNGDGGSLLFRDGAPRSATPVDGVGYCDDATASSTAAADSKTPQFRPLERADMRTGDGRAAALAALRARRPVVLEHSGVLGRATRDWTTDFLRRELGDYPCTVLSAPASTRRFTHYFGAGDDRVHAHYECDRTVRAERLSFGVFVDGGPHDDGTKRVKYLQTALAKRGGLGASSFAASAATAAAPVELEPVPGAALHAELERLAAMLRAAGGGSESVDGGAEEAWSEERTLRELARAADLCAWMRTTLFASPAGVVSRLHFDHYDNLFAQLRGRKRVLLLAPLQAAALYPFPVHHPLDQRTRIHLDALPDAAAFPRLAGAEGWAAELQAGDVLFIPHHWWHHVETLSDPADPAALALSLNAWFDFVPRLASPRPPLAPPLLIELARHVEFYLATAVGARSVGLFLRSCHDELAAAAGARADVAAAADAATERTLPRGWLVVRNALFVSLATRWLGWRGLRPFFDALLHPDRFEGVPSGEPEMGVGIHQS